MNSMDSRLVRLEKRTSPKASREERRQEIREGLARLGMTYSGSFASHSDPADKRSPAEKLRDFLRHSEAQR